MRFVVVLHPDTTLVPLGPVTADELWIEFYEADDPDHAEEQAQDASPGVSVLRIVAVPS